MDREVMTEASALLGARERGVPREAERNSIVDPLDALGYERASDEKGGLIETPEGSPVYRVSLFYLIPRER